jgi:hypothetical protein
VRDLVAFLNAARAEVRAMEGRAAG